MVTTLILVLAIAVEAGAFVYYAARSRFGLQGLAAVNMFLVAAFGTKLTRFGLDVTNVGCIWYATVVAVQAHVKYHYSREAAVDSAWMIVKTVVLGVILLAAASFVPTVEGNELASDYIARWREYAVDAVPASILGFAISQTALLAMIRRTRRGGVVAIIAAMAVVQVIDSVVFFPAAFRSLDPEAIAAFTYAGVKLKMLATIPLGIAAAVDWRSVFHRAAASEARAASTADAASAGSRAAR